MQHRDLKSSNVLLDTDMSLSRYATRGADHGTLCFTVRPDEGSTSTQPLTRSH